MRMHTYDEPAFVARRNQQPRVILVVESDQDLHTRLSATLHDARNIVLAMADGTMALDLARDNLVALALLDSFFLLTQECSLRQ